MLLLRGLVVLWMASLPLVTMARVPVWTSERTLWEATAPSSLKPRPWVNLAQARYADGQPAAALDALRTADALAARPERISEYRLTHMMIGITRAYIDFGIGHAEAARTQARLIMVDEPTWALPQDACRVVGC